LAWFFGNPCSLCLDKIFAEHNDNLVSLNKDGYMYGNIDCKKRHEETERITLNANDADKNAFESVKKFIEKQIMESEYPEAAGDASLAIEYWIRCDHIKRE
jgi:hypothetical protein